MFSYNHASLGVWLKTATLMADPTMRRWLTISATALLTWLVVTAVAVIVWERPAWQMATIDRPVAKPPSGKSVSQRAGYSPDVSPARDALKYAPPDVSHDWAKYDPPDVSQREAAKYGYSSGVSALPAGGQLDALPPNLSPMPEATKANRFSLDGG